MLAQQGCGMAPGRPLRTIQDMAEKMQGRTERDAMGGGDGQAL